MSRPQPAVVVLPLEGQPDGAESAELRREERRRFERRGERMIGRLKAGDRFEFRHKGSSGRNYVLPGVVVGPGSQGGILVEVRHYDANKNQRSSRVEEWSRCVHVQPVSGSVACVLA